MTEQLFVYGTLKRGFPLNRNMRKDLVEFIKTTRIGPGFTMLNLGWYPGVIRSEDGYITGELYRILNREILDNLDVVEGVPDLFNREKIIVDGIDTWIYIFNKQCRKYKTVPSGLWEKQYDRFNS